MSHNPRRKAIAADTLRVLELQQYIAPNGKVVSLAEPLHLCLEATRAYEPGDLDAMLQQVLAAPAKHASTSIEVSGETSLEAASRLSNECSGLRIGVLNYASAKNAGGGFLNGAQAQEESLARASALYPCLLAAGDFYSYHRAHPDLVYSDRVIYSPAVPVFKDDDGTLLPAPYPVSFLTAAAPNRAALERNKPQDLPRVPAALLAGAVFGLLHAFTGISAVPPLIALGFVFCLLYEKTGSIVPGILLHMLNNSVALAAQ